MSHETHKAEPAHHKVEMKDIPPAKDPVKVEHAPEPTAAGVVPEPAHKPAPPHESYTAALAFRDEVEKFKAEVLKKVGEFRTKADGILGKVLMTPHEDSVKGNLDQAHATLNNIERSV